jgi:DNA-binding LytR/AlgR family response regulator
MHIGVIDDNSLDRNRIQMLLTKAFDGISVSMFSCVKDAVKSTEHFDLVMLDIDLGNEDGIKAVSQLDAFTSCVVYITALENRVRDAYGWHVAGYLFKGMDDETLISELKQIEKKYLSSLIDLETVHGRTMVNQREIMYVSAFGKDVFCTFRGERKIQLKNTTLKMCTQIFDNDSFLMINRSELVNLNYISSIDKKRITLVGGAVLYASRRALPAVAKAWIRRFI